MVCLPFVLLIIWALDSNFLILPIYLSRIHKISNQPLDTAIQNQLERRGHSRQHAVVIFHIYGILTLVSVITIGSRFAFGYSNLI